MSQPVIALFKQTRTARVQDMQGQPVRITGTLWLQNKWGTQPVTSMKDDTYRSIFLADIMRAMMNERGRWTGSILKI